MTRNSYSFCLLQNSLANIKVVSNLNFCRRGLGVVCYYLVHISRRLHNSTCNRGKRFLVDLLLVATNNLLVLPCEGNLPRKTTCRTHRQVQHHQVHSFQYGIVQGATNCYIQLEFPPSVRCLIHQTELFERR